MAKQSTTRQRSCVLYARISKDRDTESSIEVQTDAMRNYCQAKGWEVVGIYVDRGRSAYKQGSPRPELDRMMADVAEGVANTVVVYKLDRLARSVRHFTALWETLRAGGADFVSATEGFDTTTPMGKAMLQIAAVFAELESSVKGERITDWHELRKAAGKPPTGPRAFGYGEGRLPVPAEAALIREAADAVLSGSSLRSIVAGWKAGGVASASSGGTSVTMRGLRRILLSPHTAGLRVMESGRLMPGTWPGILTAEQHSALCDLLLDPSRRPTAPNTARHLLVGIARCSGCGTPMGMVTHPNGARYACKPRKGYTSCGLSIEIARTDEVVIRQVLDALDLSRLDAEAGRQRGTVDERRDALEAELVALAHRRFNPRPGERPMSLDYFTVMRDGIEAQIDALQAEAVTGTVSRAVRALAGAADPFAAFVALDLATQRSIITSVLDHVTIKPWTPGVNRFDQTRIDPSSGWKR